MTSSLSSTSVVSPSSSSSAACFRLFPKCEYEVFARKTMNSLCGNFRSGNDNARHVQIYRIETVNLGWCSRGTDRSTLFAVGA